MAAKKNHGCLTTLGVVFVLFMIIGGISSCGDDGSKKSSSSEPRTHEVAKKKAKKAKKASHKKAEEKENLDELKTALHALPRKTKNEITSAKLENDNMDITVTLADECLEGNDEEVRKVTKEAWEIAYNYAANFGPYPDGDLDYESPMVYVQDSAGNELGRTSVLGDFKWEG